MTVRRECFDLMNYVSKDVIQSAIMASELRQNYTTSGGVVTKQKSSPGTTTSSSLNKEVLPLTN